MILSIYLLFYLSISPGLQRCASALQHGLHCRRAAAALRRSAAQGATAAHDRAGVLVSVQPNGRVLLSTPAYPAIEPPALRFPRVCESAAARATPVYRAEAHPPHVSTRRVPAEHRPLGSHGARGRQGSTCGVPPRRLCAALVHSVPASHDGFNCEDNHTGSSYQWFEHEVKSLKAGAGRENNTYEIPRAVAISDHDYCKVTHAVAISDYKSITRI
jgi:hypothetical protein